MGCLLSSVVLCIARSPGWMWIRFKGIRIFENVGARGLISRKRAERQIADYRRLRYRDYFTSGLAAQQAPSPHPPQSQPRSHFHPFCSTRHSVWMVQCPIPARDQLTLCQSWVDQALAFVLGRLWSDALGRCPFLAGAAIPNPEVQRCRARLQASVHGSGWPDRQHRLSSGRLC